MPEEPIPEVPSPGDGTDSVGVPRADELSESQLAEFGRRYLLVSLIEGGRSPRQALARMMAVDPQFRQSL